MMIDLFDIDAGDASEDYDVDHAGRPKSEKPVDLDGCSHSRMCVPRPCCPTHCSHASKVPASFFTPRCSHLAVRRCVHQYSMGRTTEWQTFPGLICVMPAATHAGIRVRKCDGTECFPETQKEFNPGSGDLLLFAGETLSYLSAGRIPACMYKVQRSFP